MTERRTNAQGSPPRATGPLEAEGAASGRAGTSKEALELPGRTDRASLPDPARPLAQQEPSVLLAMCLFGEARGESGLARRAVAQVVINRARNPRRVFGSVKGAALAENLRRVILQPRQFSCFNPDDPNPAKLWRPLEHEAAEVWEHCLHCAQQALQDALRDESDALTANSDHYFDDSIQPPSWADPAKQTVKIGRLNFYRLYLPPPTAGAVAPSPASRREPLATATLAAAQTVRAPGRNPEDSPAGLKMSATAPPRPLPAYPPTSLPAPFRAAPRLAGRGTGPAPDFPSVRALAKGRRPQFQARRVGDNPGGSRLGPSRWHHRRGRLSSLLLALLSLGLAACTDLERTAYRTLAVTKAEYETLQQHVAEAAVHGLITAEQWNHFQVEGHRFINTHNTAADVFQLWRQTKSQGDAARLEAMLAILPRLIREINGLVESFEEKGRQKAGVTSGKWQVTRKAVTSAN